MKIFICVLCAFLWFSSIQTYCQKLSTKTENVAILNKEFVVPNLEGKPISRKIWVYLPPDYQNTKKKYPVIYMHDGQNLFDKRTAYVNEWGVDEVLNDLHQKTNKSFIVVGINNDGKERLNEYSPWKNNKYGGGNADAYLQMIISDLKPFIDKNYRTKKDAKNTAIIGSSMGGLVSYYAGLRYPAVFGKVGVFSPSFWFSIDILDFTIKNAKQSKSKLFFVLGDKEGMTKEFDEVTQLLLINGFNKNNFHKELIPNGEHNEVFWNSQFLKAITFLFDIK